MIKPQKTFGVRCLEILPGFLTWTTLLGAPLLSYYHPVWISLYIILFDLYWFLKGGNVALHLVSSYRKLKLHSAIDWRLWCENLSDRPAFIKQLQNFLKTAATRQQRKFYEEKLHRLEKV